MSGGTLSVGAAGAVIPANSDVTVSSGATFQIGFTAGDNYAAPLRTVTLNGGTLRVSAGGIGYYLNRLVTGPTGGTLDLSSVTGSAIIFTGTGAGATINGNSTWTAGSPFSVVAFQGNAADLTIAPNVTLTSHVPVANTFRITGGGTLYMSTPVNDENIRLTP